MCRYVAKLTVPDDAVGKYVRSAAGDESRPSWSSASATSAAVTTPLSERSRTAKDSRMLWSCAGGMLAIGSLVLPLASVRVGRIVDVGCFGPFKDDVDDVDGSPVGRGRIGLLDLAVVMSGEGEVRGSACEVGVSRVGVHPAERLV